MKPRALICGAMILMTVALVLTACGVSIESETIPRETTPSLSSEIHHACGERGYHLVTLEPIGRGYNIVCERNHR